MKITIPEKLSEIKLKDYQKYEVISENVRNETKIVDKIYQFTQEQIDFLNIKAVEVYCHIKINDLRAIPARDYEFILNQLSKTLSDKGKLKDTKFFTYKGVEYGFQPDLDNMTLGELIDLDSYIYKPKDYHKAMAVLYRPCERFKNDMYIIEKYEGSEKYADIMKEIPADIFVNAQIFFYNLGKQLAKSTLLSLEGKAEGSELRRILAQNGVGITQFTHLLEEDFWISPKLPIEDLENA